MATHLSTGHYRLSQVTDELPSTHWETTAECCVIRGKIANDSLTGMYGFQKSKWYAYTSITTTVSPRRKHPPEGRGGYADEKTSTEYYFLEEEFDSKKEAIEGAKEHQMTYETDSGENIVSPPHIDGHPIGIFQMRREE